MICFAWNARCLCHAFHNRVQLVYPHGLSSELLFAIDSCMGFCFEVINRQAETRIRIQHGWWSFFFIRFVNVYPGSRSVVTTARLSYIRGLIWRKFRGCAPVLVFVWRSEYSRYSLPSMPVLRTTSPHLKSLCSLHPRRPKWIILFSQTLFNKACGELTPRSVFSNKISISLSVRAVVAFGVFPYPCRLSSFCLAFNASLVFLNS